MSSLLMFSLLLGVGEPIAPSVPTKPSMPVEVIAQPDHGLVFALSKGSCGPLLQPYHPQAGDILIFRLNNPIYQAAYHISLCGSANHAAIVAECPTGGLVIVEARPGKGVHIADLATRIGKVNGTVYVRRRTTPLTPEQNHALTEFLFAQVGKGFDLVGMFSAPFKLPVCVLFKGKRDDFDIHSKSWFCTSLIVCACMHAGLMNPETINRYGTCAGDLWTDDLFLDLSWGWHQGLPITTAFPMEKDGWF